MQEMNKLEILGWDTFFQKQFEQFDTAKYQPARVMAQHKGFYELHAADMELMAPLSGKLKFEAKTQAELPAVGDWVVIDRIAQAADKALIRAVLSRKTKFSRKAPGDDTDEQVIAANIDTLFIVQGLDNNYNLRRIERYLTMAYESGASPVVILNKADICDDREQKLAEVQSAAFGVPVHIISSVTKLGYDELEPYQKKGATIAFLGSSGVGKSTIINTLLGKQVQKTCEVRAYDSKGRHTTTHREIFVMDSGALLLDTPGMRELQLWDADAGVKDTFHDIDALTVECRFSDCKHSGEPGCAVTRAVEEGRIDARRFESFKKLQKELEFLESKKEKELWLKRKAGEKKLSKVIKQFVKLQQQQKK